jgi:curved DNA-binding protein CbpA
MRRPSKRKKSYKGKTVVDNPDLYDVLGVPKDAAREQIRKAYRDRAKEAHPDKGGDAGQFALISLANDTLKDANKRAEYDKTGKTDYTQPHDTAMQLVSLGIDALLKECIENHTDISRVDFTDYMQRFLDVKQNVADEQLTPFRDSMRMMENALKRLKRKNGKKGGGKLEIILRAKIASIRPIIDAATLDMQCITRAREIMNEYDFNVEKAFADWTPQYPNYNFKAR